MVQGIRVAVLVCIASLTFAARARGQEDNTIAFGISYTARAADSAIAHGSGGIGLAWRLGHSKTGWGLATGLGWFATDIDQSIGGLNTDVGELRVKPFMAGYGYTYSFGRTSVSAELLGGYAFVSFQQTPAAVDVYRDRLGARSLNFHSSNTFVVRPQTNVWIDLSKKVGLNVSAGYAVARPRLTIKSSLGEESRRLRADMVVLSAGLVYKIF